MYFSDTSYNWAAALAGIGGLLPTLGESGLVVDDDGDSNEVDIDSGELNVERRDGLELGFEEGDKERSFKGVLDDARRVFIVTPYPPLVVLPTNQQRLFVNIATFRKRELKHHPTPETSFKLHDTLPV